MLSPKIFCTKIFSAKNCTGTSICTFLRPCYRVPHFVVGNLAIKGNQFSIFAGVMIFKRTAINFVEKHISPRDCNFLTAQIRQKRSRLYFRRWTNLIMIIWPFFKKPTILSKYKFNLFFAVLKRGFYYEIK